MKAVVGRSPLARQVWQHTSPHEGPSYLWGEAEEIGHRLPLPILTLLTIVLFLFCFVNSKQGYTLEIVSSISASSRVSGGLYGSSGPRVAPLMEDTALTAAPSATEWVLWRVVSCAIVLFLRLGRHEMAWGTRPGRHPRVCISSRTTTRDTRKDSV